ncbi:MAG: PaaI family thioesterase, partial [Limisphaerales bacterium]
MKAIKEFFKGDQFAARNNIELLEAGNGCAKAKMTLHPHHWNGLGTVHGGAIFTLADFAFAAACNSHGTVAVALNV